ncbi:family 43 glycosylhydrolase [candidate division KSB1 bacterium]|nr:family 43 glycosylhydrolase [candidate division KSB1 bacterium]
MKIKIFFVCLLSSLVFFTCTSRKTEKSPVVCNPMNLSYRFSPEQPSRREAADPTVVYYKDLYYLFASKSGGYWYSADLRDWTFVQTDQIPTEEYAPTAVSIRDTLYFLASSTTKSTIYKSVDPRSGNWQVAKDSLFTAVWDPALFLDDDGRLYLYWGCSNIHPIYGIELDYRQNFAPIDQPEALIYAHPEQYGWEVPGDYNSRYDTAPWIEGAWMNKHKDKYYLQYACPGTEYKSYCDGVYVADKPLGPFKIAAHNPFAYKPEGFAAGAGHGNTFQDRYGNYWHIGTMTISQKHMFERRLGLFPAFFDDDGWLYAETRFGDYPYIIPDKKVNGFDDLFTGWMLVSFNKNVTVSSSVDTLPPENMTDEDIRTYWAAKSGDEGEWACIDLGNEFPVFAVQLNFAEHNTDIHGRQAGLCYQYIVEASKDGENWKTIIDKSENLLDRSHDFNPLPHSENCRFLRMKNIHIPGGHFALSGFRVFGKGLGDTPAPVNRLEFTRYRDNQRMLLLIWNDADGATGYNIRFGIDRKKLFQNYQVYQDTMLTMRTLDVNSTYYLTIDSFNENGVTGVKMVHTIE